jgi:predicted  nucleic acid-binding Zn-ribbon protein
MKDIRSLLLVLLSFGLVATWIYHLYDKSNYSHPKTEVNKKDSATVANGIRDSMQKTYLATLDFKLDSSRNSSDSLQAELTIKINEINKLKAEISSIVNDPNSTASQLALAKQKMSELEEIIKELRKEKAALELEKQKLNARLDQVTEEVNNLQQNIRHLDDENKGLTDKIKSSSVFMASALHFTALNLREAKEQETSQSKKADKFIASFVLQNNLNEYMNAEVIIVIINPNGQVMQSSTWDSGLFDTKTEGKKNFTRKIKFDYSKGEQKALIFSLEVDSFQKGTYTLQIWHNGQRIGETSKTLS